MVTQERLKELLHYDPETGIFTWKVSLNRRIVVGSVAGTIDHLGYRVITIGGVLMLAHRLAWLYVTGSWPLEDIDHRDRNRANNRIENLREASRKQNMENTGTYASNSSGFRGVSFNKTASKWRARVNHYGREVFLGYFATPEAASAACEAARCVLYTHHNKDN